VEMVRLNGKRFDCGSVAGFMAASSHEFASRGFW
jgi:UTP-glucose-1-phosphate uridylyltransferase